MKPNHAPFAVLFLVAAAAAGCSSTTQPSESVTAQPQSTPAPSPIPSATGAARHPIPFDPAVVQGQLATGLPITGDAAEHFLASAKIVELDQYESRGITRPRKATLSDGSQTHSAQFKDIDTVHSKVTLTTGNTVLKLYDTYKHEIAAYQLAKLLGLNMVPPCVERRISRDTGSLCLWVVDAMTEADRKNDHLTPPDLQVYNDQMHDIKLFLQLTWDTDYNNISNIMIDKNWRLYKVDSSRAFRVDQTLRRPEALSRFRRSTIAGLRSLSRDDLDQAMKPWLSPKAVDSLWRRRGLILEIVDQRIAAHGEAAVLYD